MTAPRRGTVVDQAIGWLVKLQSGRAAAEDWEACRRWQADSPEHALAWQRLQGIQGRMAALPPSVSSATLETARRDIGRRRALGVVGVVFCGGAATWLGKSAWPVDSLLADYSTGTGERLQVQLPDGSALWLDTATAVDVAFDDGARRIALRRGRILLTTGADAGAQAYRPLTVHTGEGTVRALGTRFMTRQEPGATQVQVFAHGVELQPASGAAARVLEAGQQGRFTAGGVTNVSPLDADADAWTDGVLVARDMRLADFVAELARYRRGRLACDEAVAGMRISGVFSVNDTEQTLALVARTLPVRVQRLTPYWVTLAPRR